VHWFAGVALVLLGLFNAPPEANWPTPAIYSPPHSGVLAGEAAEVASCWPTLIATRHGRVYDVIRREGESWRVLLPVRPNGATGLIPVRETHISTTDWSVRVSISARRLTVSRACRVAAQTPVGVGKPATPTPLGRFYVVELNRKAGPYGPFAYSLSAHSRVLQHFDGGEGRIGLHGVASPSDPGRRVSHGCVRVPDRFLTWMTDRLPLGTPVAIGA
jgi:lipoprotein-anchoring transpeptidase ErfK/SrfK